MGTPTLGKERRLSDVGSANFDGLTMQQVFEIDGEPTRSDAMLFAITFVGASHATLPASVGQSVVEIEEDGSKSEGTQLLLVLNYAPTDPGDQNDNGEIWEWDMVAQTSHINSVKLLTDQNTWNADTVLPASLGQNLTTVIGVNGDTVTGADVFRTRGSLRVTKSYPQATVDAAFRTALYVKENTVNVADFADWAIREVLFLGARITTNYATARSKVVYNFLFGNQALDKTFDVFAPDATLAAPTIEVTVGEFALGLWTIFPFQHVWFDYEKKLVPDSLGLPTKHEEVNGIKSVNVATVYETSDFSTLDIVGPE